MDEVRPGSSEAEQTQSRDSVAAVSAAAASSSAAGWRPRELAFAPCVPRGEEVSAGKSQTLRAGVRKPVSLLLWIFGDFGDSFLITVIALDFCFVLRVSVCFGLA